MTTLTASQMLASGRRAGGPDRLAALRALARYMAAVRTGRARHELRLLSDHMLADMGLTRADLDRL